MDLHTFQSICQTALTVGLVVAALGGYGSYQFGKMADRHDRAAAEARERELREGLDLAVSESRKLEVGHEALRTQLAPFQEIATRMNPTLEPEAALTRLFAWVEKARSSPGAATGTAARRISAGAAKVIVETLRARGSGTVVVSAVKGDAEGYQYALDLQRALQGAGWSVSGPELELIAGRPMGLIVQIRSTPAPPEAEWLMDAFKRAGLRPRGWQNGDAPTDGCRIIVGEKEPRG